MNFTEVVKKILENQPMTPQQIRDEIKKKYPEFYGTESHQRNFEKGHYNSIDHAVLAQIYSIIKTNDNFLIDKSTKPLTVIIDKPEPIINDKGYVIEDYEKEEGIVYVLKTNTFTKDNLEIIKIGFTTQDVETRINQLYTTGVPFKFTLFKSYPTKNYIELEKALHKLLEPFKLNNTREFFTEEALEYIDEIVNIHSKILNKKMDDK
ncbi:GIY-YIG nuclease family protein [Hydrogenimonas sp. SS33]|uniref:GIY-YIG nuclease family protein n=1 Tax=Hydrogenimonas leucolamina TaxID=2954236 RepID=UPI00336BD007